ncbi:MBG domain-containing protein [Chitinophaga sancti]|uniref:Gliding motility-associated C-terminal domain-containing protein n=1 Tax=Chitinophaga sancti TaxID=1004 RepID=A0A1K1SW44_9BACT|nr:MBG domain-containing protein [Chitinophaga sancti]WQD63828.1 MBG domain-containing protein [Chitinophaga sancti]WQG90547.1 MBG domain-containing protein [Chitinophaga sancti]SFW88271.1 gliding motility-associated C-terminal domain-containing protein [Chitinophaga sancti]
MKRALLLLTSVIFSVLTIFAQTPDANGRFYVKKGSSGTGDSWSNALGELSTALLYANSLRGTVKEIWVAGGTYAPAYSPDWSSTDSHNYTFKLVPDVSIYGGFAGTETTLADRNLSITANTTILTGEIGDGNYAYHVVLGVDDIGKPTLDGLTITRGMATGPDYMTVDNVWVWNTYGGGIYMVGSCGPVLSNLVVTRNSSASYGAGIAAIFNTSTNKQYQLVNSSITYNTSNGAGGGIANYNSSPTVLKNLAIKFNNASVGAAIYNISSSVTFESVRIKGNTASSIGSALNGSSGTITFKGCEVTGNKGSGYCLYGEKLSLINTTVASNNTNAAVLFGYTSSSINNSVIYGNQTGITGTYTANNSLIQGVAANPANKVLDGATNPGFTTADVLSDAPADFGDYQLINTSPLINAGNNSYYAGLSASTTDIKNDARVYSYNDGGTIDIGANEYQGKFSQTITALDFVKTYGDADFDPGATASSGLQVSYSSSDNSIAAIVGGKISIKKTGTVTITASQAGNGDYYPAPDITFTVRIVKANLVLKVANISKTYDGTYFHGGSIESATGFAYTDGIANLDGIANYSGSSQGATNVGSYDINLGGYTSTNYNIFFTAGTLTITKAPLSVTAVDDAKTYNGLAYTGGNGVNYSGFVNSENATLLSGTLAYGGNAQGATAAGTYTITPSGLSASNYALTYIDGALVIGKAALTVTAADDSKTYDGGSYTGGKGISYAGFVNNEDVSVLSGVVAYSGTSQGAVNAGTYSITPSGLSAANYAITYVNGALEIGKAALTLTAKDDTKSYNGLSYAGGNGINYTGFVNSEDASLLSGTLIYTGNSQGAVNAGNYVITPSGLSAANYSITYANGNLAISKAALTVTAADATTTYNGLAYTGGNGVNYTGFVNNETSATLTGTLAYSGNSQGAVNAGNYIITPSGLSAANYDLSYTNATLTITKAPLTVIANNDNKVYDGTPYTGGNGISYTGFVNNETQAILAGTLAYTGTSQGAVNATTYTITPSGLSAVNYNLTYTNGTLTITKAPLTVSANNDSKVYNGASYSGGNGVSYTGFVNNETAASLTGTLAYTGTSQGATNVGSYTITPSGLLSQNYSLSYVDGTLSISKASLTVTANNDAKVYDANLYAGGNGVTYTGFVNNETASVLSGSVVYGGSSQGAMNASTYTISPSGLIAANYSITYSDGTLTITKAPLTIIASDDTKTYNGIGYTGGKGLVYVGFTGADNASVLTGPVLFGGTSQGAVNTGTYTIVPSGRTSLNYDITFVAGTLTISKAPLTITAVDAAKTYDGLSYTGGNGVTYTGFVNNENATALSGNITYNGTSQGATTVGTYVLTPSGINAANYTITFVNGSLSISKATLTVTAMDDVKTYNGNAYTGGNGVTYTGFVNNDNATALSGNITYSGSSQGAINAGTYTIIPAGLTTANYAITYVNGTLSVSKALVTITANDAARCYNTADPSFSLSYNGFISGEDAAVLNTTPVISSNASPTAAAGIYTLTAAGATADNYTFNYINGTLTIYALPVVSITTPNGAVLCGDNSTLTLTTSGASTYTWSNGQSGDAITVNTTGTYSLTATDARGCTAPAENTVTITTATLPVPAFTYDTYCAGTPVNFTNTGSGNATYTWTSSDGQSSNETSPAITFKQGGTYTVTLTALIAECPAYPVSVSQDIAIVNATPNTRLADVTTAAGVPVLLTAREISGATYGWLPVTGLSATDSYHPVATLTQSQRYYISMAFESGCITTDTLVVNVSGSRNFVVANAFTPNNDGVNDVLHVGLRGLASLEFFDIYDRWGTRVFRTTNTATGWEGLRCDVGTYTWVAQGRDYKGQLVNQTGTVILIR